MKNLIFLFVLPLILSCTVKENKLPDLNNHLRSELREIYSISEFNGSEFFARPAIVTPLENGHFLIADTQILSVHHFNDKAKYLGTFGREGKGPGEFLKLNDIFLKSDTVYIVDGRNVKINSYLTEGENVRFFESKSFEYMMIKDYPLALFREFIPSAKGALTAVYYDFDNLSQDEMKTTKMLTIPYSESPEQQKDSLQIFNLMPQIHRDGVVLFIPLKTQGYFSSMNDGFAYALNDEPKISIYNVDGSARSEIKLPDTRKKISKEEKEAIYNFEYRNSPDPLKYKSIVMQQMPDQRPVIRNMKTDAENRIWVQIYRNDESNADWFVYEENGKPVVNLEIPEDLIFRNAKGSRVYAQRNTKEGPEIVILEWS